MRWAWTQLVLALASVGLVKRFQVMFVSFADNLFSTMWNWWMALLIYWSLYTSVPFPMQTTHQKSPDYRSNKWLMIQGRIQKKDVTKQGLFFLRCTNGSYLILQGDVLPNESLKPLSKLQYVFWNFGPFVKEKEVNQNESDLTTISYQPFWKPWDDSPCLLPGLSLISDSCGQIPR